MLLYVVRTLFVYVLVMLAMRLMGKRQLGELEPTELVTTLLISNLASICIEDTALPITASIVPVLLVAALETLNSALSYCFPAYELFLVGKPIPVIQNGIVNQHALMELRISAAELLESLRMQEVFSPQEVYLAVVETNGSLSVYPAPQSGEPEPMVPLVVDGRIMQENLTLFQKDQEWLSRYFQRKNIELKQVFMLLANKESELLIEKQVP